MTRVLVVWEDDYADPLGLITRRLVRATAPGPSAIVPGLLFHTTRGNGAFERYVHRTWPAVRPTGLPRDPGFIDHLVCVIDGDRLHDLLTAEVPHPPTEVRAVGAWHAAAERAWQTYLHGKCDPAGPPLATVHGVVLRWSKESLLLAGYDQPAMDQLDILAERAEVAEALAACTPRPQDIDDALFTDTFRRPGVCLEILRKARGLGALHKNAPEIDDALRALDRESLMIVRSRVPDIGRVADLVWRLHLPAPIPAPEPPPAPDERRPGKKPRRSEKR